MSGIFNAEIFNNAIFNVGETSVTRATGGGPPRVQWGEWTTPWTSPVPGPDVRAIVGRILDEEVESRGIEAEEAESAHAVEREIEARAEAERAHTLKAKRRAAKALRAEREAREHTFGQAYNAAFEAAFARYLEQGYAARRRHEEDEDAIAIILMLH